MMVMEKRDGVLEMKVVFMLFVVVDKREREIGR